MNSRLDWQSIATESGEASLKLYRKLLQIRHRTIVPLLKNRRGNEAGVPVLAEKALQAWWTMNQHTTLVVFINLHEDAVKIDPAFSAVRPEPATSTQVLYRYCGGQADSPSTLSPKSIVWLLDENGR